MRHMQYFLAVAEHNNFARAAHSLGITQPPLSQGVQRLERQLETRLFYRRPEVRLTPDGEALLARARVLVEAAEAIVSIRSAPRAGFVLGVTAQMPSRRAAALVRAVRLATQDAAVPSVVTAGSVALIEQLTDGRLDAAVVVHPMVLDAVYAEPTVTRLRTWALLPEAHPLAGRRSVGLGQLAGSPLVTAPRSDNPAAHDLLRDVVTTSGLILSAAPAPDDRSALLAAAAGHCIALSADARLSAPGCARVALDGDPVPLRIRLVWPGAGRRAPDPDVRAALLAAMDGRST